MLDLWQTAAAIGAFFVIGCAVQQTIVRPQPPFTAVMGPVVIAHRGGSLEAPENTLAAVRHGVEVGADWQEIDVTLTRDGRVVAIHDDTLERTTTGTGLISEHTLSELRELDAGRPRWDAKTAAQLAARGITVPDFGDRFAGERIPTLDEVLAVPGVRLMIELKRSARGRELVERVIDAVRRAGLSDRVALASFDPELLWAAYDREPTLPLVGIVGEAEALEPMLRLPLSVLAVSRDLATAALDRVPPTLAVWVWTVADARMAKGLVELGVNGLITDAPAALLRALRPPFNPYVEP